MKRTLALILALLLLVALFAGCGGTNSGNTSGGNTSGGNTSGGNTSGGDTSGGNTSGGNTSGGDTSGGDADTPPPVVEDDSPYKFAAGKYAKNDEGFPVEKYEYELPISTTDEVLTNWTVNWTPQYLPEDNYQGVPTFSMMQDMTGIHMEWNLVSSDVRSENLAVMLASDDLDDLLGQFNFFYTAGTMEQAIDEEYIVNLYDYRDYMPNYLWEVYTRGQNSTIRDTVFYKDDIWVAFFGMYKTPMYSTGYFLRQDWMDKLGLGKASDLQTYDDLYNVLTAFKVNYPSASPMMIFNSFELEPYNWLGYNTTPYNQGLTYIRVKDGDVMFTGTDQEDLELMQLLNQWWNEGLIDPNYASYTSTNAMSDALANSLLGYCIFTPSEVAVWEQTCVDPDIEWAPVTRLRRSTDQTIYWGLNARHTNYGSCCVSATSENIELAVTWLDWNYSEFGSDWMNWGPEGESADAVLDPDGRIGYFWYYNDEGERRLTDWCMNHPAGVAWLQDCMCYNELGDAGIQIWERNYAYEGGDRFVEMFDIWNDAANDFYENRWNWPTSIVFDAEDTEELNALRSDATTLFQEQYIGFFEGTKPFSEWDSFQSELNAQGMEGMTAIYQEYYDNYMAAQ